MFHQGPDSGLPMSPRAGRDRPRVPEWSRSEVLRDLSEEESLSASTSGPPLPSTSCHRSDLGCLDVWRRAPKPVRSSAACLLGTVRSVAEHPQLCNGHPSLVAESYQARSWWLEPIRERPASTARRNSLACSPGWPHGVTVVSTSSKLSSAESRNSDGVSIKRTNRLSLARVIATNS